VLEVAIEQESPGRSNLRLVRGEWCRIWLAYNDVLSASTRESSCRAVAQTIPRARRSAQADPARPMFVEQGDL
jgi:hypothetical protein